MKRPEPGIDTTIAAVVVILWLLVVVLMSHGCNAPDLTRGNDPSPTPSVAVTVTPPPCPAALPTPGPPPNVTATSLDCGNANRALAVPDTFDGDGDAFQCVWLCTSTPTNPTPHEQIDAWNITAEDGDANSLISTTTLYPCCVWQP